MEIKLVISLDADTKQLAQAYIAAISAKPQVDAVPEKLNELRGDTWVPMQDETPAPKKGKSTVKTIVKDSDEDKPQVAAEPQKSEKSYEPEEIRAMLVEVKRAYGVNKLKGLLRKYAAVGEVFTGLDTKHYSAIAADIRSLLGT